MTPQIVSEHLGKLAFDLSRNEPLNNGNIWIQSARPGTEPDAHRKCHYRFGDKRNNQGHKDLPGTLIKCIESDCSITVIVIAEVSIAKREGRNAYTVDRMIHVAHTSMDASTLASKYWLKYQK